MGWNGLFRETKTLMKIKQRIKGMRIEKWSPFLKTFILRRVLGTMHNVDRFFYDIVCFLKFSNGVIESCSPDKYKETGPQINSFSQGSSD